MSRVTFAYHSNPAWVEGGREPSLLAAVDLTGHGAMERIDELPVYEQTTRLPDGREAQVFGALLAGIWLERSSLAELETTIDHYLGVLVHYGRLPDYLFQLGDRAWPIYRLEDNLIARFPGSRTFSAGSIGELRNDLADHFKKVGIIDYRKEMTVLYLSRNDLQPYAPVCTLRAPGPAETPVFRDKEETVHLFAPLNGRAVVAALDDGEGLLALPGLVGDYLVAQNRLADADAVGVRKLTPAAWAAVQRFLHPYSRHFTYFDRSHGIARRREIPIYVDEARGRLIAARTNRMGRVSLHFAPDIPQLQYKVGEELTEIGKVAVPTYVTVGGIEEVAHLEYVEGRGGSNLVPLAI
jgi:hypothetical protein